MDCRRWRTFLVGCTVGFFVGFSVGARVGNLVGCLVGCLLGFWVGLFVGLFVGCLVPTHPSSLRPSPTQPSVELQLETEEDQSEP